jgi:hypothetical protein
MIGGVLSPREADDELRRLRALCQRTDAGVLGVIKSRLGVLSAADLLRLDERARFGTWQQSDPLGGTAE